MNQKSIFSKPVLSASVFACTHPVIRLAIAASVAFLLAPEKSLAQGQYPVAPERFASVNQPSWTPPGVNPVGSKDTLSPQPPLQSPWSNDGFPEEAVEFASPDQAASFAPNPSSSSDRSLDSTIDSTASMLSNLSDSVGETTSGWLASLKQNGGWTKSIRSLFGATETGKMVGSLALVLGIYFAFVWVMRKINPGGNRELPPEVVSVMGQVPFGPRQNLQLVRLGSKLLLFMNSPEGTQPIGEISDALEVEYLSSLCAGKSQNSSGIGAIHMAAKRLAEPAATTPQPTPTTNLSQVIKMLERATQQGGAVFEA